MNSMFNNCQNLTDISALANWDVSNVTSMYDMFYNCQKLTDISALANWNTSSVITIMKMFANCINLTSLTPILNWNTSNVTTMMNVFNPVFKTTSAAQNLNFDFRNWDMRKVINCNNFIVGGNSSTFVAPWDFTVYLPSHIYDVGKTINSTTYIVKGQISSSFEERWVIVLYTNKTGQQINITHTSSYWSVQFKGV